MRAIFTFHSVDDKGSVISCRPQYFSMLLETLIAGNIPVLDLSTLLRPETQKGVAITFDDGMRSVYQNALPVIREHGVPAHLFLATAAVEGNSPWPRNPVDGHTFDMLGWGEIEALRECGVLIESHTHLHPDMRTLTVAQMDEECGSADDMIESKLGRRPEYFAYPFGYHNKIVRDRVRQRYKGTVTTELRQLMVSEDTAALPRIDTYYLQSGLFLRHIDSTLLRAYLAFRNILRTVNGSQCIADCE